MSKNKKRIGRRVAINGKLIDIKPFDKSTVKSLEEMGAFTLSSDKPIDGKTAIAAMVGVYALSAGVPVDVATQEINEHIRSGGNVDRLLEILTRDVNNYAASQRR